MDIEMSGFVHAKAQVRTLGQLRQLVSWCDEHNVLDEVEVDWGTGYVYVVLTGDDAVPADWIECGNHLFNDRRYDFIIDTHYCPDAHDETPDTAPARYDWAAKDREVRRQKKADSVMSAEWRYHDLSRPE